MIKRVVLAVSALAVLSLVCVQVSAQGQAKVNRVFGVEAGANFGGVTVSGADAPSPSSEVGFCVGGFMIAPINPTWGYQVGLRYQNRNSKFSGNNAGSSGTWETKFAANGLQVPAYALFMGALSKINMIFGAGAYYEYDSYGDWTRTGTDKSGSSTSTGKGSDVFKSSDYGLGFKAAYYIGSKWQLTAEYQLGLANIAKGDDYTAKRTSLNLNIAYMF